MAEEGGCVALARCRRVAGGCVSSSGSWLNAARVRCRGRWWTLSKKSSQSMKMSRMRPTCFTIPYGPYERLLLSLPAHP